MPVPGGLSKSDECVGVWIERLNLKNERRAENSIPMDVHEIKESFARGEK
jgi:hypothetical protein